MQRKMPSFLLFVFRRKKTATHAIFHYRFCVGCHCFPCFLLIIKLHRRVLSQLLCVLSLVRCDVSFSTYNAAWALCLSCTHPPIPLLFISIRFHLNLTWVQVWICNARGGNFVVSLLEQWKQQQKFLNLILQLDHHTNSINVLSMYMLSKFCSLTTICKYTGSYFRTIDSDLFLAKPAEIYPSASAYFWKCLIAYHSLIRCLKWKWFC